MTGILESVKMTLENNGFHVEICDDVVCAYHDDMTPLEVKYFMENLLTDLSVFDNVYMSCKHEYICGEDYYYIIEGNFERKGLWANLYGKTIGERVIGF